MLRQSTLRDGDHAYCIISAREVGNRLCVLDATDERGHRTSVVVPFRCTDEDTVRGVLRRAFQLITDREVDRCCGLLQSLPVWHSTQDFDPTTP